MIRKILSGLLLMMLLTAGAAAAEEAKPLTAEETKPLTAEEILSLAEQARTLTKKAKLLNDPTDEDAVSEDGIAFQYSFGVIYADESKLTKDTAFNAVMVTDGDVAGPRGTAVEWDVNQMMEAIPCGNPEMNGTYEAAALYLEGSAEEGFLYGRAERDGQRISALEYGAVDPKAQRKYSLTYVIGGDSVTALLVEGMNAEFTAENAAELYEEMQELTGKYEYARVPRSRNGGELAMFGEEDLWFSAVSFRTAEPEGMGDNVEDMMIDNDDGTWLRRVDGDGFEAVFTCDAEGRNARLLSYVILSPDLEGPRAVRLGDYFHEDYSRFRSGEGELDESGMTETLYGTVGTAPYGLAEYGDGTEMALRYVTPTLGGPDVELILRYQVN